MVSIAVLDLATPFPGMEQEDGAGELIVTWLAPSLAGARFEIVKVALGQQLPQVDDYDAFVLSGSEKGVYDTTAWMDDLRKFLLEAKRAGKPLVGVCFGHQIMADTFGGRAEKVPLGLQIGVREFEIDGVVHQAHVWHQDQVTVVPPDANVIGHSQYCPVGVLAYDFPAFSVQFHPEFTAEFLAFEIRIATGTALSADVANDARQSIGSGNVAPDLMSARAAQTLLRAG